MKAVNKFVEQLQNSSLSNVVKTNPVGVHVTSHKGNFGHLMGAAGSVEAAFAALSLFQKVIPPTINFECADDGMQIEGQTTITREVVEESKDRENGISPKLVLKNSFGFGGTNVSLLFGEFRQ